MQIEFSLLSSSFFFLAAASENSRGLLLWEK